MKTALKGVLALVAVVATIGRSETSPTRRDELVLMFTAQRRLSIVPGGCQLAPAGGIAREASLKNRLRRDWELEPLQLSAGTAFHPLPFDEGNPLPSDSGPESLIAAWNGAGLHVFHPSARDLALGTERIARLRRLARFPFVATNVRQGMERFVKIRHGGAPVLILGVADPEANGPESGWKIDDPLESLRQVISTEGKDHLVIVLSSLGEKLEAALLRDLVGAHIILSSTEESVAAAAAGIRVPYLFAQPDLAGRSVFVSHLQWASLSGPLFDLGMFRRLDEELAYARLRMESQGRRSKWGSVVKQYEKTLKEFSAEGIRFESEFVRLTSDFD